MKKIISFIILVSILFSNTILVMANTPPEEMEYKIYIHKILMGAEEMKNHNSKKEYDPSKPMKEGKKDPNDLTDEDYIKDFFGDDEAKEIPGIYFAAFPLDMLMEYYVVLSGEGFINGEIIDKETGYPDYKKLTPEILYEIVDGLIEWTKQGLEESDDPEQVDNPEKVKEAIQDMIDSLTHLYGYSTGEPGEPLGFTIEGGYPPLVILEIDELSNYTEHKIVGKKALPYVLNPTGYPMEDNPYLNVIDLPLMGLNGEDNVEDNVEDNGEDNLEDNQEVIKEVHLYPKNTTNEVKIDKFVGEPGNKTASYDIGEEYDWIIENPIPYKISAFSVYQFIDELDSQLTFVPGSVRVSLGDKDNQTDITEILTKDGENIKIEDLIIKTPSINTETNPGLDQGGGGLVLDLTDYLDQIEEYNQGKELNQIIEIRFKAVINKTTKLDEYIPNDVSLKFGQNNIAKILEKPRVKTGGAKFVKIDADAMEDYEEYITLEDAKFKLLRNTIDENGKKSQEILVQKMVDEVAGGYFWIEYKSGEEKIPDGYSVMEFISDEDGKFEIRGLNYGKYELIEIEAPDGYKKLEKNYEFDIVEPAVDEETGEVKELIYEIPNYESPMPDTGGIGIISIMGMGLALMGFAIFRLRKSLREV